MFVGSVLNQSENLSLPKLGLPKLGLPKPSMKIAYLTSQKCLPGEFSRPEDLKEHGLMMTALLLAKPDNWVLQAIAWDTKNVNWHEYHAVVIGTTWDYCDRYDEFLAALKTINQNTTLFNSLNLVRWNSNKQYLRELEKKSIGIVPTFWVDDPSETVQWASLFAQFDTDTLVAKQQIGANAEGQFLLHPHEQAPQLTQAMMVQPFLPAIQEEGEYSLIFINGEFSHAALKRPKTGDYRIQASYGGAEFVARLSEDEINTAKFAVQAIEELPLYARVDMVRGETGELLLMELELVEPYLYPEQGESLGTILFDALKFRLG